MTRRKGELTTADLQRQWPHHVAVAAEKVRGLKNSEAVHSGAAALSAAPRPFHMCCDGNEYVVFCFAKPEDAEAFADSFDGNRLVSSLATRRR